MEHAAWCALYLLVLEKYNEKGSEFRSLFYLKAEGYLCISMLASSRYFIAAGFVLALGFSCDPPQKQGFHSEPAVSLDLDAIVKRGYLNALVDNNSISYFIYKGRPMGYEYELLQQLADHLK